ncbi:hypothetical protein [Helcococcus massiliensis]|uniref:hypothetical protein n=1 Tax=Helcococcus massiliensis TaxID=2040290 RepID=UPI000CDE804D|nr:hypothetical protein [Helcococcus massiliensis]
MKNKIIIALVFVIVLLSIFLIRDNVKSTQMTPLTDVEARGKIEEIFGNKIEKINDKDLILTSNSQYTIMVVEDRYLLIDYASNPPKVHHYKSIKEDIPVKIVEIYEDGSWLALHDDHTHIVTEKLEEGAKVGDTVYIKDPHTFLDDYKHKKH